MSDANMYEEWNGTVLVYTSCSNCESIILAEETVPCVKCGQAICQDCMDKQTPPLICMRCIIEGIAHC